MSTHAQHHDARHDAVLWRVSWHASWDMLWYTSWRTYDTYHYVCNDTRHDIMTQRYKNFFSKLADFWYLGVFGHEKSIGASPKLRKNFIGVTHVNKLIFSTFLFWLQRKENTAQIVPEAGYLSAKGTSTSELIMKFPIFASKFYMFSKNSISD